MSLNFKKPIKYRDFIRNPIALEVITEIYKKNKINTNRVDLYHDFIISLCELVFETYLGDDLMSDEQRIEHFKWCWDKNIAIYKGMGYNLRNDKKISKYFEAFFVDIFYSAVDKDNLLRSEIQIVWGYVFNYNIIKSREDIENFIDLYGLFDDIKWYK